MTIAEQRLDRLETLAAAAAGAGDHDRARRYVRRARRIAERQRLSLPRSFRRRSCDRCDRYLRWGATATSRLQDDHVVVTCDCGAHKRIPYE